VRSESPDQNQSILFNDLKDLLDPKDPLYRLTAKVPWAEIEAHYAPLYSHTGRPAKPARLMVSLLMLKHLFDLSDEQVVDRWRQNPYYQYFSGMRQFQWGLPCDPTDLVYFRKRIGPGGAEDLLKWTVQMSGKDADATVVVADTTAQEKNVTYPRDRKLYRRVAERVLALARSEQVRLTRTYRCTIRRLAKIMITGNFPRGIQRARRAERRMRTIAGRLLRDLRRKLTPDRQFALVETFSHWEQALRFRRTDEPKIYSLHEPQIYAIKRGKDAREWEFGTKVSIAITPHTGVIVGAMNIAHDHGDLATIPEALEQIQRITGTTPAVVIGDKGYRGRRSDAGTLIYTPADIAQKTMPTSLRQRLIKRFRRRASIEPIIGHLKSDHRLCRNYLKGWLGDEMNVLLAAAGWNLRRLLRRISALWAFLVGWIAGVRIGVDRSRLIPGAIA
jgi:IS5 family transposase